MIISIEQKNKFLETIDYEFILSNMLGVESFKTFKEADKHIIRIKGSSDDLMAFADLVEEQFGDAKGCFKFCTAIREKIATSTKMQ
jgi:hypothetical protein